MILNVNLEDEAVDQYPGTEQQKVNIRLCISLKLVRSILQFEKGKTNTRI